MRKVVFALCFLALLAISALTIAKPVMVADGGSIPLCPPGPNHLPQCNPAGGPK